MIIGQLSSSDTAQEMYAKANKEFPTVGGIPLHPVIEAWGDFKEDLIQVDKLGSMQSDAVTKDDLLVYLDEAHEILLETRPTAVNLKWGLDQIMKIAQQGENVEQIRSSVIEEAKRLAEEDVKINMSMGKHGSE